VDTIEIDSEEITGPPQAKTLFSSHAATLFDEDWSLLSARSPAWNESFSRVSVSSPCRQRLWPSRW
jgi:hypothetical protein